MGGAWANLFWTEIPTALFGGYGGGLWRKRLLLELEKRQDNTLRYTFNASSASVRRT